MRILQIAVVAFTLAPLFAQSPKSTGTVTATTAEFRIPLQQPANQVWIWNCADTPDNANEYSWTITAKNGTQQYSFGFYLFKLPGSHEARGQIQDLLRAGQASVFKEDAEGRGEILLDANVAVTVENAAILVRITNPELVHLIFGARPETVAIHSKTPAADYQIVRVIYRD
ncbi:MAG: hypothetical protein WCA21_10755 [Terracidiphilus sp.]